MLLLDTCTLLWLVAEPGKISGRARKVLEQSQQLPAVSAISALEIGIKHRRKKLVLPCPIDEWFSGILEHYQFEELAITSTIASNASLLPQLHSDPFDRLIIATALSEGCSIVTPDHLMQAYPGVQTIW